MDLREKIEDLIVNLARAKQISGLYGDDHQVTQESINYLYKAINDIFMEKNIIVIGVIGNEIAYEKTPFFSLSRRVKGFIAQLKALGLNKINISMGVTKEELSQFISILSISFRITGMSSS